MSSAKNTEELIKPKPRKLRYITWALLVIVVITLAVAGGFMFGQKITKEREGSGSEANKTSAKIIAKVGDLFEIPTNEQPTVAKIQDKEKLKDQKFFDHARNGDYLLVYADAQLAIIYRESANKLVNVGPVTVGNDQSGQAAGAETTKPN